MLFSRKDRKSYGQYNTNYVLKMQWKYWKKYVKILVIIVSGWLAFFFLLLNLSILPPLPRILCWSETLSTALEEIMPDPLILLTSQAIINQASNSHGQALGWGLVGHGKEGSHLAFSSGKLWLDFRLSSQHLSVSSDINWGGFLISKIKNNNVFVWGPVWLYCFAVNYTDKHSIHM